MKKKKSRSVRSTSSPSNPSNPSPTIGESAVDGTLAPDNLPPSAEEQQGRPAKLYFSLFRVGIFAILVFVAGAYWGNHFRFHSNSVEQESMEGDNVQVPRGLTPNVPTEPEDFYPAAEYRKQSAILVGCKGRLHMTPQLYVDIAKAIGGKTPLFGVVQSVAEAERGAKLMKKHGLPPEAMRFLVIPTDTMWIRDYAPIILRHEDDSVMLVDARYQTRVMREERLKDEVMGVHLARMLDLPLRSVPLLIEGGNLASNGDGLVATSLKTFALNNFSGFTKEQLKPMFEDYLGTHTVIALDALMEESTGHIDMLMTFLGKNLAVVAESNLPGDSENKALLENNVRLLKNRNTSSGPIQVSRIPMPPKWGDDYRSYTNVIMANGVLLMPSYSDVDPELENRAAAVYKSLLPNWVIKRINCDALVRHGGQLHCISYNIPHYVSIEGLKKRAIPSLEKKKKKLP